MEQQPITRCKFHAASIDNAKPSAMCRLILYAARKPAPKPVEYSHFRKTGNIRLLRKADVPLIKKNLTIKVVGDFSEINVVFSLKNNKK